MPVIALDHIVILVPASILANPPDWLTSAFTIIPGGRHANGLTENKLVLFSDGVYIELIAFVDGTPEADRNVTRWGRRADGQLVDFALTLLPGRGLPAVSRESSNFSPEATFREFVQKRVRLGQLVFDYADPVPGGRVTPEGRELQWAVSAPVTRPGTESGPALLQDPRGKQVENEWGQKQRPEHIEGDLPFWCLDRTPREWRVPFRDEDGKPESATQHASGATGVSAVEVRVQGGLQFEKLKRVYDLVLGQSTEGVSTATWSVESPAVSRNTPTVVLRAVEKGDGEGSKEDYTPAQISLRLFTKGPSRKVSGEIGNGGILEIELVNGHLV